MRNELIEKAAHEAIKRGMSASEATAALHFILGGLSVVELTDERIARVINNGLNHACPKVDESFSNPVLTEKNVYKH